MQCILKKALLIAVAAYLVLLLSSCKSDIVEGTVIEKTYVPASTYVTSSTIIVGNRPVVIPQTQCRGAQYILILQYMKDDGTYAITDIAVSPEEYAEIEVGDWYTNCKEGKDNAEVH